MIEAVVRPRFPDSSIPAVSQPGPSRTSKEPGGPGCCRRMEGHAETNMSVTFPDYSIECCNRCERRCVLIGRDGLDRQIRGKRPPIGFDQE